MEISHFIVTTDWPSPFQKFADLDQRNLNQKVIQHLFSKMLEAIAGVATAGISSRSTFGQDLGPSLYYVRSNQKVMEWENMIEGKVTPGQKVGGRRRSGIYRWRFIESGLTKDLQGRWVLKFLVYGGNLLLYDWYSAKNFAEARRKACLFLSHYERCSTGCSPQLH